MPYFVISDFRAGVDTRAPVFQSDPGSLSLATDMHLTQAGHLEVRKAFVQMATLPAGTFGLTSVGADKWVFGSVAAPSGLPIGFFYQRLQHPAGAQMTALSDVETFDGKFYAIADYTNDVVHFYDAVRVDDWLIAGEVDADAFTAGRAAKTLGEKIYAVSGPNLHGTKVAEPTKFKTADDGFFINMSTHSAGSQELVGVELYYENLAIFSRQNVQLWNMAADPTQNRRVQTIPGVGLVAPRAALSYLDGDTAFISYQGIKSITTKDSSGRSKAEDMSAKIDRDLVPYLKSLSTAVLSKAILVQEPEANRLWVCLGERIYVLNWFPSNQIRAWTEYRPGFVIDDVTVSERRVWVRSGDNVYLYGGESGEVYYEGEARARLPYITLRAPATFKGLHAFDAGVEGTWTAKLSVDPDADDEAAFVTIGIVQGQTYDKPTHPLAGSGTHMALEFVHTGGAEYARLSSIALHYKANETG